MTPWAFSFSSETCASVATAVEVEASTTAAIASSSSSSLAIDAASSSSALMLSVLLSLLDEVETSVSLVVWLETDGRGTITVEEEGDDSLEEDSIAFT